MKKAITPDAGPSFPMGKMPFLCILKNRDAGFLSSAKNLPARFSINSISYILACVMQ